MVTKASLQLRIGTQLTMTPQLQQAIALLQLSTLDLRQEIQQALDANPMLEQEDEFGEQNVSEPQEAEWSESIPNELSVDSDWSDTYKDIGSLGGSSEGPDFERQAAGQSLHGHLLWQLAMTDFSPREYAIAESLIDALDGIGYLTQLLQKGKSVVTANKEVMAKHGPELLALAQEQGDVGLAEAPRRWIQCAVGVAETQGMLVVQQTPGLLNGKHRNAGGFGQLLHLFRCDGIAAGVSHDDYRFLGLA